MEFMEFKDWLDIICQVGTLIFAALTYFKGKKIAEQRLAPKSRNL